MSNAERETKPRRRGAGLAGVKVLELAWVIAGPLTGKYFADNGATVVRVESSKRPDMLRVSEPFKDGKPGFDRAGIYAFYGANKYSLGLDLKNPGSRHVLERLIRWADLVTENFAPGKMEEMGLGYEELKRIRPDIIMVRISIQGQTGPDSRHPGYGILAAGLAGVTGLTGWPDRLPSTPVAGYTDVLLPRYAALMMLAALNYRKRTGKGQCIDLSQFEATQHFLTPAILDYQVNKRVASRQGNVSDSAAPHNAYKCRGDDRWCALSVSSDEEWKALCVAMERGDLVEASRFATFGDRRAHQPEIDGIVQTWIGRMTAQEAVERLQAAGIPAGVVQNAEDMVEDPQLDRSFWRLDHPAMGPVIHLGQAFTFERSEGEACSPAPCLGQDTERVCKEILGMSDEEFVELVTGGVFE